MSSKTVDLYVMSVLKVMFKVIFDNIIFFYQNWTHKYQGLHICKKKKKSDVLKLHSCVNFAYINDVN